MTSEINGVYFGVIVGVAALAVLVIGVALIMLCTSEKATNAIETKAEEGKVTLNVLVHNARVFEKQDVVGKGDPYVVLYFNGEKKKTQVQKDTLEPQWNEEFSFAQAPLDGEGIKIELWDEDSSKEDDLVGTATIADLSVYAEFADGGRHSHTLILQDGEQKTVAELDVEVWAEVQHGGETEGGGGDSEKQSESEGGESQSEQSGSEGEDGETNASSQASNTTEGSGTTETGAESATSSRSHKAQEDGEQPPQSQRSAHGTARTHHTSHTHHTHHSHGDGTTTEGSNADSELQAKTSRTSATHRTAATHVTSATHHTSATHKTSASGHSHSHHHGHHHGHKEGEDDAGKSTISTASNVTKKSTATARTNSKSPTTSRTEASKSKSPVTSRTEASKSKSPTTSRTKASNVSEYSRSDGTATEVTVIYEGERKKKAVPKGKMDVDNTNTEWLAYLINDGRKEDKKKKAEDM